MKQECGGVEGEGGGGEVRGKGKRRKWTVGEMDVMREGGVRQRKGERWGVQGTDYDDHFLNYVLHINKHHISFAVIFKAFPLALQSKHLTQHELKSPRVQAFCYNVI